MNCSGLILHLKYALGHYDWEVRLSLPAVLALEDGTLFRGLSIGASGTTVGEVVFNTAMTGYQEVLTDPSYAGQIVTMTYPSIGTFFEKHLTGNVAIDYDALLAKVGIVKKKENIDAEEMSALAAKIAAAL